MRPMYPPSNEPDSLIIARNQHQGTWVMAISGFCIGLLDVLFMHRLGFGMMLCGSSLAFFVDEVLAKQGVPKKRRDRVRHVVFLPLALLSLTLWWFGK